MKIGLGMGRLLLVALLAAAIVAFFAFDLGRFLTFDALNANKARLQQAVAEAPLASALAFGLTYTAVTALSLPVATALSILAGALFGRLLGTAIVDVSATAGAALAFLSARYLLRDWVESRLAAAPDPSWHPEDPRARRARRRRAAWQAVSEGLRAHGLNYLLVLRLIPVVPFFLINIGSGLTAIPFRTFVLGTLIGILPGVFLYVNAGSALGTLTRPADLLSAQVVGALTLLALFSLIPVAWRRWRKA